MSDELYSYIDTTSTPWLRHYGFNDRFANQTTGWHFCFPRGRPATNTFLYSWGAIPRLIARTFNNSIHQSFPSTEEFFGGAAQTHCPVLIAHYAGSLSSGLAITNTGSAYIVGSGGPVGLTVAGVGNTPPLINGAPWRGSANGAGPNTQDIVDSAYLSTFFPSATTSPDFFRSRNTRHWRFRPIRIFGKEGELADIEFTKAGFGFYSSWLLSSHGNLFVAGHPSLEHFCAAEDFPDDQDAKLVYFKELPASGYINAAGDHVNEDILITDASSYDAASSSLLCVSQGGLLLARGTFALGSNSSHPAATLAAPHNIVSPTFYEVAGFIDTASVVSGGVGVTDGLQFEFPEPENPNGTKAVGIVHTSSGVVTGVSIVNPGYGYTSAPSAIVPGSQEDAEIAGTLFGGQWMKVYSQNVFAPTANYFAITTDGTLYVWGVFPRHPSARSPIRLAGQPQQGVSQVAAMSGGGLILATDGTLYSYGYHPDTGAAQADVTLTDKGDGFVQVASAGRWVCALHSDGTAYTYGFDATFQGRGANVQTTPQGFLGWGAVVGSAKWSAVFGGPNGIVANRMESFDEYGNRLE